MSKPHNPSGKGGFADHPENINTNGRPAVEGIRLLREAMAEKSKEKKQTLYEKFVELAYTDKQVLIEAMKKLVPNAQSIDVTGEMTLKEFMGVLRGEEKPDDDEPTEEEPT